MSRHFSFDSQSLFGWLGGPLRRISVRHRWGRVFAHRNPASSLPRACDPNPLNFNAPGLGDSRTDRIRQRVVRLLLTSETVGPVGTPRMGAIVQDSSFVADRMHEDDVLSALLMVILVEMKRCDHGEINGQMGKFLGAVALVVQEI